MFGDKESSKMFGVDNRIALKETGVDSGTAIESADLDMEDEVLHRSLKLVSVMM